MFVEQLGECIKVWCYNSVHWYISLVIITLQAVKFLVAESSIICCVSIQVSAGLLGNLEQYTIAQQLYQDFLQQEVSGMNK